MSDERTPQLDTTPLDTTPLGRSVEEVEEDGGNTQKGHDDGTHLTPVPAVAAPMGGGVSGVPAVGAQVLPVVPGGEDVTGTDEHQPQD